MTPPTRVELTRARATAESIADVALQQASESDASFAGLDHHSVVEAELRRLAAQALLHRRQADLILENAGINLDDPIRDDAFDRELATSRDLNYLFARLGDRRAYTQVGDRKIRQELIDSARNYSPIKPRFNEDGQVVLLLEEIEATPVEREIELYLEAATMFPHSQQHQVAWVQAHKAEIQ